ncbi:MAG: RNA polymerase sigma factor RpoD, partial [Deltaproteobacteria bacterium HGW-Deltaproteobacteria-20]
MRATKSDRKSKDHHAVSDVSTQARSGTKHRRDSDAPTRGQKPVKAKEASKPKGAKGSKEVQQLIDLGRSKGFLTYEEVNDALPQDVVAPDQIDDVISALGDEDIQIVDVATQVKIGPKRIADQEAEEAKKVRVREEDQEEDLDAYYSRSNDPVRMYLRKMGSVSLLTREGEVEIAKRIEDGELMVLDAILNSPIAVREIIELGDKLRRHKIRVKDIIRDAEDDDQNFDE